MNHRSRAVATSACISLMAWMTAPLPAALTAPVRTENGQVSGVAGKDSGVVAFKGIPFAAPPVGDLRWKKPQPAASWQGVRKAEQFSAACVQNLTRSHNPWTEEFIHQGDASEDCLYLNVWTSAKAATEKRPVLVWFYGGGFNEGSTAVAVYDGEALAKKGLIVVSVNYRVGVMGFLVHPELTKESDRNSSGNYGLLDQLAGLEWVHKNIAAFGGDPNQVTIAGQSAGASSVHYLTASPLAKGLFHQAIAESGSSVGRGMAKRADAEANGVKFAEGKGAHSLKELRAMPVAALTTGTGAYSGRAVVDGWFLPADPTEIFAQGKQNDVATLTGLNADEGSGPTYGKIPAADFEKQVRQRYGDKADLFLKLYPLGTQEQAGVSEKESSRDQGRVSMYLWAKNRVKTGKTSVYTYYFTHPEPWALKDMYGVFHSSELPYVFHTLNKSNRPWEPADTKIADMMSSYWVNFVTTGDPNGKGLTKWPAFQDKSAVTMELGDQSGPRPVADKAKLEFWEAYLGQPSR